jgi:hypothetical protein
MLHTQTLSRKSIGENEFAQKELEQEAETPLPAQDLNIQPS